MNDVKLIELKEDIMADNVKVAESVRDRLRNQKTMLINLMSSPGSGKTTFIIKTAEQLAGRLRLGVIEADIDSKVDAEKVAAAGVPAIQLRTGGFCHLDATMVTQGLDAFAGDGDKYDLLIIENVGNLVCPAEFDTGAHRNIMLLSVPEGDDKVLKYPLMFSICDVLLISKMDYMPLSDFDMAALRARVRTLNPNITIFEISSRTGAGIGDWVGWLVNEVDEFRGA